jgi:hypothetical protein
MSQADIATVDAIVRWISSLAGVFAVPVIVLVLLVYLFRAKAAPERIGRLLAPFTSVKVFGQELTFRAADPVTRSAVGTFLGYRHDTMDRYRALVKKHRIAKLHQQVIDGPCASAKGAKGFRSTIHVLDVLFAESYYQLLPYYRKGGGEGRSWSIRFGIVGNTWRHGVSHGVVDIADHQTELIDVWGMTADQARNARNGAAQSLIAVILRNSMKRVVGIFYADALETKAFGADQAALAALAEKIVQHADAIGLTKALADMVADLPPQPIIPMLGEIQDDPLKSDRKFRRTDDKVAAT